MIADHRQTPRTARDGLIRDPFTQENAAIRAFRHGSDVPERSLAQVLLILLSGLEKDLLNQHLLSKSNISIDWLVE